jgi:hypothetical protein
VQTWADLDFSDPTDLDFLPAFRQDLTQGHEG